MALTNEAAAGNAASNVTPFGKVNILDGYNVAITVPAPFTGGTNGTRGDKDAAGGTAFPLFTTRGEVKVICYGVSTVTPVGAGSLEVGVSNSTAIIIPQIADATGLTAGKTYVGAAAKAGGFTAADLPAAVYLTNGQTILEKVATADVTAGNIYYVCLWIALSPDATVKAVAPSRVN